MSLLVGLRDPGHVLLLYGPVLKGLLEATGHDEPCACMNQMLWRGGGQRGGSVRRAEASVSQQPLSLWCDKMLPLGTVGAQICPDISEEHKGPLSLASNIIAEWWEVWMATVDISAGVHMKQKRSKRYKVEEGVRGGYATGEGLQWALRRWRHEII